MLVLGTQMRHVVDRSLQIGLGTPSKHRSNENSCRMIQAMMNSKKRQRLKIDADGKSAVVGLDDIEIWDGADLALLREVLGELIERDSYRRIGVNLHSVKYIPSGFFGMLYDLYEKGIAVTLYSPQPNVASMLWFKQFCQHTEDGRFLLKSDQVADHDNPTEEQVRAEKEKWEKSLKQSSDFPTTAS